MNKQFLEASYAQLVALNFNLERGFFGQDSGSELGLTPQELLHWFGWFKMLGS